MIREGFVMLQEQKEKKSKKICKSLREDLGEQQIRKLAE
jgi:hypothetical protein